MSPSDAATRTKASGGGDQKPKRVEAAKSGQLGGKVVTWGADYAVVAFLIFLAILFTLLLPDRFPTWANVQLILGSQAIPALLAMAVLAPLIAGEFDLSVAATLGFTSVLTAYVTSHGMDPGTTFVLALAVGALVGIVNGFLVTGIGVSAFIATLGVGTILAGGNLYFTSGQVIFKGIDSSLTDLARTTILGLPIVVFYALALILALWYVFEWTPFGRYLRATGANREAARLTGVKTARTLFISFVIAGLIAGLAGFLLTARQSAATPGVGPEFLLPAYAAAFLGATTINSGKFNVWGTVVSVLVLAVGINGLNLIGVATWVSPVFNGVALLVAISFAAILGRRRRNATV